LPCYDFEFVTQPESPSANPNAGIPGASGCISVRFQIQQEKRLRRSMIIFVVAVVGSAMVAHPRSVLQTPAQNGVVNPTALDGTTNARVVIASGIEARSLAIQIDAFAPESTSRAPLYVTAADQPNRLFSLSSLGASTAATAAGAITKLTPIAGVGA